MELILHFISEVETFVLLLLTESFSNVYLQITICLKWFIICFSMWISVKVFHLYLLSQIFTQYTAGLRRFWFLSVLTLCTIWKFSVPFCCSPPSLDGFCYLVKHIYLNTFKNMPIFFLHCRKLWTSYHNAWNEYHIASKK